eukprot:scaffold53993_cov57-Phaeocystis_antarctica.AAC.5
MRIVEQAARRSIAQAHHPPCDAACRHRSTETLAPLGPRLRAAAVLQQQPMQHGPRAVAELRPDGRRVRSVGLARGDPHRGSTGGVGEHTRGHRRRHRIDTGGMGCGVFLGEPCLQVEGRAAIVHEGRRHEAAIASRGGGERQHPLRARHECSGLAQRLCGDRLLEWIELGSGPRLEQQRVHLAALVDAGEEARGAQLITRRYLTAARDALQRRRRVRRCRHAQLVESHALVQSVECRHLPGGRTLRDSKLPAAARERLRRVVSSRPLGPQLLEARAQLALSPPAKWRSTMQRKQLQQHRCRVDAAQAEEERRQRRIQRSRLVRSGLPPHTRCDLRAVRCGEAR